MPLNRDPFFQSRSEWAKYKHRILENYLRVWIYKLSSTRSELAFVDTCAGEGTYGVGEPGSPLIAAQWNDRYLEAKGKRLLVVACERRKGSFEQLGRNLAPYIDRSLAVVMRKSFVHALPEVLDLTKSMPTLIFIDPYGLKDLTADNLRPLLKSRDREPTEVLVRVPPVLLARFTGWLKQKERDERTQRIADAFGRLLVDLKIDPELLSAASGENPVGVNELLLSYLSVFEERFRYVQAIPVRESYYSAPRYYLVHGTDSEHGIAHMNDIVSKAEDDQFEKSEAEKAGAQQSLFDEPPTRALRVTIEDAEDLIVSLLGERPKVGFMMLRAELARVFGPDLRAKHHKQAVKNLTTLRIIEPTNPADRLERQVYRLARPGR